MDSARRFLSLSKPGRTFVEEHHGGVAGRGVFPRLVVSVLPPSRATRLGAPELTRHKHPDLGVEPASVQTRFAEDWDSPKDTNITD